MIEDEKNRSHSRPAFAELKPQLALAATLTMLALLPLNTFSQHVLLEAEQFADLGGWDLDQQSMHVMGSPYLLAHGLGVPVKDASTTARFPTAGAYRVWVRTRDWVAPWNAPGAPGKFQMLVNGKPLAETFGTKGAAWHWQSGGTVAVGTEALISLHDLTGFEGRCDAILFSKDPDFVPPNEGEELARFRRSALGLPEEADEGGEFDLVVAGGGIAGTCAALSAARNGLRVALVQDRPVLGGNGSSEVRVWPEGNTRQKPYPRIGDIVEELVPSKRPGTGNAKLGAIYDDQRKLDLVRAEPRITLMTEQRVYAVTARGGRIESVDAQHIRTARRLRLRAKLFADCTGDATVGFLAGANYEYSHDEHQGASNLWNLMDASDPAQLLKCECKDKDALTISVKEGNLTAPFPRCPWAVDLTDKPFPGRKNYNGQWANTPLSNLGGWFWETGFQLDMINDVERIRDQNFRAMYGAWDALKNVDKLYPNHRLAWAAFIAGKRESRRLLGDVILTGDDFRTGREFPDGCYPCSWHIDIHTPHPDFDKGHTGNEFISRATTGKDYAYKSPYWAPYRSLYSRNISNLFLAGRNISVTREGLGPVRVMKTCGMMGEIVGKAAWICVSHGTLPRGVYERHLPLLKELMAQPGAMRRDRLDGALALPPGVKISNFVGEGLDPAVLEGLVIDDTAAELQGNWGAASNLKPFVGDGYRYSSDPKALAKFPFIVKKDGNYEVRVNWQPHPNRAKAASVLFASADGETIRVLDQTKPASGTNGFQSLGVFRLEAGRKSAVIFKAAGAQGNVHIDAVQVVPTSVNGASATPEDDYNFNAMLRPVPTTAKFSDPNFNIWCGSAIKGDDGKFHLFYSRWPRNLGHLAWVTHSEIAHAVSDSPLGPWKHQDVALPARGTNFWDGSCTHNPTVTRIGAKFYLYYMGNYGDGMQGKSLNWTHRNHQRIGVAVADSPSGPWVRFDRPVVDINADTNAPDALVVTNPSVTQRPDGSVLMIYKAVGLKRPLPFGGPVVHLVATADRPTGPFTKYPGEVFSAKGVLFAAEDPFIWYGRDRYWAIVKDNAGHFTKRGYSLALWESKDGFDWKLARHPLVATPEINWADGQEQKLDALERPQLLFENGLPIALFCAAADNKSRDGSYNVQIPFRLIK